MDAVQITALALAAFGAGFWLARRLYRPHVPTLAAPLRPDIPEATIRAKLSAGRRVEALRLLRAKHGYGVRDARRDAEALAHRGPVDY